MFPHKILIATLAMTMAITMPAAASAQTAPVSAPPPVKVNVLNVCSPSADAQKELSSVLAKVPDKPAFSKDYEVSRGHSTLDPSTPIPGMEPLPPGAVSAADWVRVRREFPDATLFSNVQYSFSVDATNMVETLVLRVRDPKPNDLMEISVEDSASAVVSATAMLSTSTPVSRVKLEHFGKASVVLARCGGTEGNPATDQTVYEPIFHAASSIMERYRDALGARKMVPQELTRLGVKTSTTTTTKAAGSKKNP
ncbi:MAG TPA: hypothetical protein VKH18_13625 [Terriglobales bacterium]|nr:hypothetical protein [Terriglobales bacterium]